MHVLHWITALSALLPYAYEVLGGILIFYSSAVTETQLPDLERRKHWIIFGSLAAFYILVGIGIRSTELQRGESDRQQAAQDRQELRENRDRMNRRMDDILSSSQSTYLQLAILSTGLQDVRIRLTQAINKNGPNTLFALQAQAKEAQQQVDNLSHEVLALTMAPQVAQQLREWYGRSQQIIKDMRSQQWEEHINWVGHHGPNDPEGDERNLDHWEAAIKQRQNEDLPQQFKKILSNADFIRKELLQRIPPQQQTPVDKMQEKDFMQTQDDPQSLAKAAQYIDDLARRVPPPK